MTENLQGRIVTGAAAFFAPSLLLAQDAGTGTDIGTSTPPELRDFRLDSPPPRPAPERTEPQPAANLVPPTTAPQTSPADTKRDIPSETQTRQSRATTNLRQGQVVAFEDPVPAIAETKTGETAATSVVPVVVPKSPDISSADRKSTTAADGLSYNFTWIGAAVAAFLSILASVVLLRHKRGKARARGEAAIPARQPSPPASLDKPKPQSASPLPTSGPATSTPLAVREPIFAEFKPETAQLSIASLSVTGKLTIINNGRVAIDNLLIRSHMISAQNGQQAAIAAFHGEKGSGSMQSFGSLAAGERIDAVIEIRQPQNELATFRWTERDFVAPIILINLSGQAGEVEVEVPLSHLIGREGSDTSARMKPLPIDRGPKRFTDVSSRPLFA